MVSHSLSQLQYLLPSYCTAVTLWKGPVPGAGWQLMRARADGAGLSLGSPLCPTLAPFAAPSHLLRHAPKAACTNQIAAVWWSQRRASATQWILACVPDSFSSSTPPHTDAFALNNQKRQTSKRTKSPTQTAPTRCFDRNHNQTFGVCLFCYSALNRNGPLTPNFLVLATHGITRPRNRDTAPAHRQSSTRTRTTRTYRVIRLMEPSISMPNDHIENQQLSTCPPHHSALRHTQQPYTPATMTAHDTAGDAGRLVTPPSVHGDAQYSAAVQNNSMESPVPNPTPKSVAFELLVPDRPQYRARLPMRVQIYPHDTTDSIITTVKNFYGLYSGSGGPTGIIFEDERGNTLIARYENLRDNMNVYVRVIEASPHVSPTYGPMSYHSVPPTTGEQSHYNGNSHHMPPPQPAQALSYGQPAPRPDSRASRKRSVSPNSGRGRRSASASANPPTKKARSQSGYKSRNSSAHGSFADIYSDGVNGYSSGDGAPCSVSSKTKSEHLGNTEISLDNIVEGGRRKRAKFESSELPLFAPPQMPAATSNSSVSPARRMENQRASLPFTRPAHHAFAHPQVLQSPQSYNNGFAQPGMYTTPNNDGRRTRGGPTYPPSRGSTNITPNGNSSGILPTPDPTIGSCMSEEDKDVALQLMRLGDMSNNSHGRTSASTLDDTFSGHADAASSTGATSESESESDNELPPARRQKPEHSPILPPGAVKRFGKHMDDNLPSQDSEMSEEYDDGRDATFKPEVYDDIPNNFSLAFGEKARSRSQGPGKPRAKSAKPGKTQRPANSTKVKAKAGSVVGRQPMSPASIAAHSRKTSVTSTINFQHQLGEDEEDLSSKPRCQRCRKSKKGCDRQRPCQRCKDAGLSADQCISEDEGNGRKGRYGRHMGVKVKKDEMEAAANALYPLEMAMNTVGSVDKNKKRKR
ncbi:hypothetical protein V493_03116 [Pseudogymnoascus sp. VKM F-4281 (FW-2241)]|nr:hypothetical protein V493_03116 [Pseudogymnoascus sp. VKM F-4281 (FW-2241)]